MKIGDQVQHKDHGAKALVIVGTKSGGVVVCRLPGTGKDYEYPEEELKNCEQSGPLRPFF